MRLVFKSMLGLFAILLVAGCGTPPQRLDTASGKPEIVIPHVERKQVIDTIVASKLEKGLKVLSVSDYSVVVGKVVTASTMASFLYGSRYDSNPEARITYNIVETGDGVRVFSSTEMVTNPGSGFERKSDVTGALASEMQNELVQLRDKLAH